MNKNTFPFCSATIWINIGFNKLYRGGWYEHTAKLTIKTHANVWFHDWTNILDPPFGSILVVLDRASVESCSNLEMCNTEEPHLRFNVGFNHLRLMVVCSICFRLIRNRLMLKTVLKTIIIHFLRLSRLLQDLRKNLHIECLISLYLPA